MWHEARRQERKIRGMLVDYRRRAERRRDFYEKIRADPLQFLQLHGRPCRVHLEPGVAAQADSPATMMPWQGHPDNLIDRFDVRAHLDIIPPLINQQEEESYEERQCNYERYRILAQNAFLGISEEKFLKQLYLEEQFGYMLENDGDKKRKHGTAIGFNYDEPGNSSMMKQNDNDSTDSDNDLDVDLCIDVSKVDQSQAHEMNRCGQQFGMLSNDFYSFLINDLEEAENIKIAREEEHEKSMYLGRKSRRERRAQRVRRLTSHPSDSPLSYALKTSPTYPTFRESKSKSKSPSPVNSGQITYITSFGNDDEETEPTSSRSAFAKVKVKQKPTRDYKRYTRSRSSRDYRSRHNKNYRRGSRNRSRSFSRSGSKTPPRERWRRSRSHSRSRSKSFRRLSRSKARRRSSSSSSSNSQSSSLSSRSKTSHGKSPDHREIEPLRSRPESPRIIQRYYGRKQEDRSSSDFSLTEEEESNSKQCQASSTYFARNNASVSTKHSVFKMTPQERLKKKMQILLNKQYKADKIAEQNRIERVKQEQRNREDELREMALKLRRKQRERRHAYDESTSRSSDSDSSQASSKISETRRCSVSPSSSPRNNQEESRKRRNQDNSSKRRDSSPSL